MRYAWSEASRALCNRWAYASGGFSLAYCYTQPSSLPEWAKALIGIGAIWIGFGTYAYVNRVKR